MPWKGTKVDGGEIMSLGTNENIVVATGGAQQKNAMSVRERHVTETSSGLKVSRQSNSSSSSALGEDVEADTASISRPGIVALESAQNMSDETVIRDKDAAGQALTDSTSQMADQPQRALETQANQTPQQILALLMG